MEASWDLLMENEILLGVQLPMKRNKNEPDLLLLLKVRMRTVTPWGGYPDEVRGRHHARQQEDLSGWWWSPGPPGHSKSPDPTSLELQGEHS